MGYRNLNSGSIRQQRRQQSRLSTQAPVGGSSVGHGSGLRFYDGGELIIDGLNTGMRFWIQEVGGGRSAARLQFTFEDMTDVASEPAVWSQSTGNRSLNLAGPLLHESTAADGYGGSNLFLSGDNAFLVAGNGGVSASSLRLRDNGHVGLYGENAELYMNVDGSLGFNDGHGRAFWINSSGNISVEGSNTALRLNANGNIGLRGPGAEFIGNADGWWSIGDTSEAAIQGQASGRLNMFAPGGSQMNGDFSVAGEKNFIMDHPTKPGYTIKYASTESPISGIEDRGRVTISDDGTAQIVLPEHFTAIVKPDTDVDIILQPYGPDPAWCEPPTHEGTTVHGEPGTIVTWRAFAQRIAKGFEVVEKGSVGAPPEPEEGGQ